MKKPTTVPMEALWNASGSEWELGKKNDQGKYVGEWKWWLYPNGHLCCHTFFDDNGTILSFKRFHPNGEISRLGTYNNGVQMEDIYFKSSEPTTENFAYGSSDTKVYKAVKRPGVPVSFDYYDQEGNHLNPPIETKELIAEEETEVSPEEVSEIRNKIFELGKGFIAKQFDSDFYLETIIPMIEFDEYKNIFDNVVRTTLGNKKEFVYHEGDLHLRNLHCLEELEIGVLVVNGNLIVDGSIRLYDDPLEMLVVTGSINTKNIVTSGFIFCFNNVTVSECIMGDYNDCSTFIKGNLEARFFYPEEYFFKVNGEIKIEHAFGNSWRLNEDENRDVFNWNNRKLSDFIKLLNDRIHKGASFNENKSLLDDLCEDRGLFEYIERQDFMNYIIAGNPVFKN